MRIFNYLLGRIMLATFMCVACLETYAQLDYKMAGPYAVVARDG